MDRKSQRAFEYHASVPYLTGTPEDALEELNEIVTRLQTLYDSGQFHSYEFGSAYAHEVSIATRDLMAWQKRKLDIPLDVRMKLTSMYVNACFDAVEPSLMVKYGSTCIALWKSNHAKLQLTELRNVIDWRKLIRAVRNTVILASIKGGRLGSNGGVDGLSSLFGNNNGMGNHSISGSSHKSACEMSVALSLASMFRCTVRLTEEIKADLDDEILSFLGPHGHDPAPHVVLDAYTYLLPYSDPSASTFYIPKLFELWNKVTPQVASLCILPAIAEFAEQATRQNKPLALTDEQLDICFQAVLHSLQIPLIPAQKSKAGGHDSRKAYGSGEIYAERSLHHKRSTVNTKPFGTQTGTFSKLVVWSTNPDDLRPIDLLDSLVNAVLSFCHPSNVGPWTALIFTVLMDIATAFVHRHNIESEWRIEKQRQLTQPILHRVADILKQPVLMGIHSQAPYVFATALDTLRSISLLAPSVIVPSLLSETYPALQHGLHEPHRLITSLACLARVAAPMTSSPQYEMHLTTLLELSLSNIDANESKRCLLTLAFFQAAASLTKFEDKSSDSDVALAAQCLPECVRTLEESGALLSELLEDDKLATSVARGTSAAYPEIMSGYMRRIFELLETTTEQRLESAAAASVLRVLLACSNSIFDRLLNMTLEEILNPQQVSHEAFAQVCASFVRANSKVAFRPIWQLLNVNIRKEIEENQAGSGRTVMPNDKSLLRYLSILNMVLLAANSASVSDVSDELMSLLRMLREATGLSVVYTVANTLHHAIAALSGFKIVLPNPAGGYPSDFEGLNIAQLPYLDLAWNIPTEESQRLAVEIFQENIDISEAAILNSVDRASISVTEQDILSSALVFMRTAIGSISVLTGKGGPLEAKITSSRSKIFQLISQVYFKLSRDDISGLKEVLFVAKVLLCDVGYERTARLDAHQETLYQYEKRYFKVPGAHKRNLPPAVLARRAQLFHHQLLSLGTQHRNLDPASRELLINVILDACFSAYPTVRRNAFSALYSPLKIFADQELYEEVYSLALKHTRRLLDENEYERACGGFALLKYRSMGLQTVGYFPSQLLEFMQLVSKAASSDNRHLINSATGAFFALVSDTFRVGSGSSVQKSQLKDLMTFLTSETFESLHWREALFRATALQALTVSTQFPLSSKIMRLFSEGSLLHHPELRTTSVLGLLNSMQKAFRYGLIGYDFSNYKADGEAEIPAGASQSERNSELEYDWSLFFMPAPLSIVKSWKSQPRPGPMLLKVHTQGWLNPRKKLWRAPTTDLRGGLRKLKEADEKELKEGLSVINSSIHWRKLINLHAVEPRAEDDSMLRPVALLFRNLIVFAGLGYCSPGDTIESLLNLSEFDVHPENVEKNWHRIVSEIACGMMLATPLLSPENYEIVMSKLRRLLETVLRTVSPETISYWISALVFSLSNVDHRRLAPVIEIIEAAAKPNEFNSRGGSKLSLKMDLYSETMAVLQWHRQAFYEVVENWQAWNHGLQTTRESCGDEVSLATTTVRVFGEQETVALSKLFDYDIPKSNLSLLYLMLKLLRLLGGDACLDLLSTKAFNFLLTSSAIRDDAEVVVLVTNVFAELAVCTFSTSFLENVAETIIHHTQASSWHQRIRMLLLLQSFFFNHLLTLDSKTRYSLTMVTVDTLHDAQAEVRELAADTLAGIIRCSPEKEQDYYVDLLCSKLEGSVGQGVPLVERHAAVLGLGSLIGAFPYSSPPPKWIPKLLALLAVKAAGDSGIVGKSVKQILGDFKKTRQDTWHIDQKVFSQDELDDLDGVLWKNYFA